MKPCVIHFESSILKHAIRVIALRILIPNSSVFWTSSQKSLVLRIQPPNLLALWYSLVFQLSSFKVVFQFWDFLKIWNKLLTFILRRNNYIVYILVSKLCIYFYIILFFIFSSITILYYNQCIFTLEQLNCLYTLYI